ncbi:transposase, partial [Streptomyces sp. WM6391]|uniref:transposase n=1 Tax=Streptomyces sp. WM6391 TaxID=1415559 RepID=UPI003B63B677
MPKTEPSATPFRGCLQRVLRGHHVGMVRRHELTDVEWEVLSRMLPQASSGGPRLDDRVVLNGIVWKLRTGTAWR